MGRAEKILSILRKSIPDATIALKFRNPLELLVATILSAQCTDERVNMVTEKLFKKYRTAADYARASLEKFEREIRPTGFFRSKARSVIGCCSAIVEKHGGRVPSSLGELVELPGVGRKTASIVLGHAFGKQAVAVDTHVRRVARRLGLSDSNDPEKIERDIMRALPRRMWTEASDLLIWHGRLTCTARKPACGRCPLYALCRWEEKTKYRTGGREGRGARQPVSLRKQGGASILLSPQTQW